MGIPNLAYAFPNPQPQPTPSSSSKSTPPASITAPLPSPPNLAQPSPRSPRGTSPVASRHPRCRSGPLRGYHVPQRPSPPLRPGRGRDPALSRAKPGQAPARSPNRSTSHSLLNPDLDRGNQPLRPISSVPASSPEMRTATHLLISVLLPFLSLTSLFSAHMLQEQPRHGRRANVGRHGRGETPP